MMQEILKISQEAGQRILKYYGDKTFSTKEDASPITQADQDSHSFLCAALKQVQDTPILSEENVIEYAVRKDWAQFWLIDPLDGTKEFINNCDEFCINIAIVQHGKPTLGAIYAPALEEFYFASLESDFQCIGRKKIERQDGFIVGASRFHHSENTKKFMDLNNLSHSVTVGAALKFGRMALGEIDLYPRFEGSKEWDTGAGQIILEKSGGFIIDLTTMDTPVYNKMKVQNNYFIAGRSIVKFDDLRVPKEAL